MKQSLWIKICLVLLLGFFAVGNGSVCAAEKVVLQLPWHHQFQFAGYYMAEEQGFYRDAGLDVEIRDVSKGSNPVAEVLSGRADFGISGSGLLVERSLGKAVVAIAAIFQHSPVVFLALGQSDIHKPADLIGKKVMLSPGFQSLSLLALLHQEKLFDKIERLDTSFDYHSLLNGETDIFNAYRTNEPYLLKTQGYQTNIIDPKDYGIDFYGDVLFTSEPFLQKKPKVVEKFRQASLKGWDYALNHPDEAIAVIRSTYQVKKTVAQLQFEAAEIKKIIRPDQIEIGAMELFRWAKIVHHLMAVGQIPASFNLTDNFLYEPPQGIQWQKLRFWIFGVLVAFAILVILISIISKGYFHLRTTRKSLRKEIEERKQIEETLRQSENKFRLLADHTHDWEYWITSDGEYIYLSPACEEVTGYRVEEFISDPELLFNIVAPDYIEKVHQHYRDENNQENPHFSMEFSIMTKAGEERWLEHNCTPIFDEHGNYIGRRGNNRDITQRKKAEALLSEASKIINRSPTVAFLWKNVQGWPVEFVSENVEKVFGYPSQDFMQGRVSYNEVIHSDDFERVVEEVINNSREKDLRSFLHAPYRIITKNGELRWVNDTTYIRRNSVGEITHYEGVVYDITDLKQAEEERSQLLEAIDQSSETIVITDLAGKIQYANPAFEKISGYTRKEAIGQNPRILQSGQQDELFYQELWKALTSGEIWRGKFINKKKDGSLYTEEATISPVRDASGNVVSYIAVKRDITYEAEMEEQLRQKFKMEAIGVMAGGMAHNFNNNLAIILGNVELSLLKLPQDNEALPLLENAKIAVLRSRDLIQQVMTYSRKGAYSKTSIQLPKVIDESLALLQSTLPSTVNVRQTVSMNSRDIFIHGDPSQIQEVIVNLCNNAVHAMDQVGDLTLSLETVDLKQKEIPAQYDCTPGCYAKLSIQDNGSGMSSEVMGKIFDLFFTTKEVDEGTGVGLSTVQGIIDHHGGLIKVHSLLGEGTTFDLYFPIIERREKKRIPPSQEQPRGTEKILFVDDEEMLANVWSEMLREYGYQVSTMFSSVEALKLFAANPDFFDLVVTDQTMPELVGKDLIQELLKIKPDQATILCTGYSSKVNEDAAKNLGISAFCLKPLELPALLQTVRRVLDEKKG